MKWDHHKGCYQLVSGRLMAAPAGVFGLTIDGHLTGGFAGEVRADNPAPEGSNFEQKHPETRDEEPLTQAEREEIASEMISRWLKWLLSDGFQGACKAAKHTDAVKVPGIERVFCTCAQHDDSELSTETARLLDEGIADVIAGRVQLVPVETTD